MITCGKVWYPTQDEAMVMVDSMKARLQTKRPDLLGAYFCENCEGWHVGHNYYLRIKHLCVGEMK